MTIFGDLLRGVELWGRILPFPIDKPAVAVNTVRTGATAQRVICDMDISAAIVRVDYVNSTRNCN